MTEPRWLDDREAAAWRGFTRLQAQLNAQLNRDLLRESGLSLADYEVLVHLSEATEQRLRAFQLSAELQWEKSRLSHHLRRMERRGLVERAECESDARGAFVVLTDLGRRTIEAAAPRHVEQVRRYLVDGLTSEQLDTLAEVSRRSLARLTPDAVREA